MLQLFVGCSNDDNKSSGAKTIYPQFKHPLNSRNVSVDWKNSMENAKKTLCQQNSIVYEIT